MGSSCVIVKTMIVIQMGMMMTMISTAKTMMMMTMISTAKTMMMMTNLINNLYPFKQKRSSIFMLCHYILIFQIFVIFCIIPNYLVDDIVFYELLHNTIFEY